MHGAHDIIQAKGITTRRADPHNAVAKVMKVVPGHSTIARGAFAVALFTANRNRRSIIATDQPLVQRE